MSSVMSRPTGGGDRSGCEAAGREGDVYRPARRDDRGQGLHRQRPGLGRARPDLSESADRRLVVNMGPQHPSTHGVLRLVLTLDGETVIEARPVIGYLHTGIEKNMEYRTWTQGVTFVTRMDYLSPIFNETAYCLARGEAARHHRPHPRAGAGPPGAHDGAQPDLLAHGGDRHVRHGAGRHLGDDLRLPRAGDGARPVRVHHRPADEHGLRPARRRLRGPARRRGRQDRRVPQDHAGARSRTCARCSTRTRSTCAGPATSRTSTSPAAWRSA